MASHWTSETFFRPSECGRRDCSLPAPLYNSTQLLLGRSRSGSVFVPIRTMQFIAVIDREEIIFVDSQAYAVQDGEGGRVIRVAWQPRPARERPSLSDPVACEVVFYGAGAEDTQRRLVGDFGAALRLLEQRYREHSLPAQGARIVPFRAKGD